MTQCPKPPAPPAGLRRRGRGRQFWDEITSVLELDIRDGLILGESCRATDRLDALDRAIRRDGELLPDGRVNPALTAAVKLQITLARLLAALRLPEDLSNPAARPQRRGVRGIYHDDGGLRVVGGGR